MQPDLDSAEKFQRLIDEQRRNERKQKALISYIDWAWKVLGLPAPFLLFYTMLKASETSAYIQFALVLSLYLTILGTLMWLSEYLSLRGELSVLFKKDSSDGKLARRELFASVTLIITTFIPPLTMLLIFSDMFGDNHWSWSWILALMMGAAAYLGCKRVFRGLL